MVARYDGISKLSDNRWGFFPGISAGWNVHEEAFFKDSKFAEVVSLIKPRISYGLNGNVMVLVTLMYMVNTVRWVLIMVIWVI